MTMTLTAPVTYTITSTPTGAAPYFVFKGVGNLFLSVFPTVFGTLTYSINGGAAQTFTNVDSGRTLGSIVANDVYIYGPVPSVTVGDTVLLSAGALTTTGNIAAVAPANGAYATYIFENNGTQRSTFGSSVSSSAPEPGTLALLALGIVSGGVARRRK